MRTVFVLSCALVAFLGCADTLTKPPGSRQKSMVWGAFLGAESRIAGDIMKFGFPDTGMVRYREGYVISYDARKKVPHWVAERLNARRMEQKHPRKGNTFWIDHELMDEHRSRSYDYAGSGYVRGRLAAAANHQGDELSLKQTYLMSNTAPQMGAAFRQGFWVHFEGRVRDWAREADDLYVFTGPLYLPKTGEDGKKHVTYEVIGEGNVAVPTHFFKVMLREAGGATDVQAFIVPHMEYEGALRYSDFLVSVDEVERLSGLDFFSGMDQRRQARLESVKPDLAWGETHEMGAGDAEEAAEGCGEGG